MRQVLVKEAPAARLVLSGIVTSQTNTELSEQPGVAVGGGRGVAVGGGGSVGGTGVAVAGKTGGVGEAAKAWVSWAETVCAAAVPYTSCGFWESGKLQAASS